MDTSHVSVDDDYQVPVENSSQSSVNIKGGYRLIVDANPPVVQTSHKTSIDSQQPYCLHPQDSQTSLETSTAHHNRASHCRAPQADPSRPPRVFTEDESGENGQVVHRSTTQTEERLPADFQSQNQQEPRCTQGPIQKTNASTLTTPKAIKNPGTLMEDIVERNKITLGRSTSKHGSYVKVHSLKQETPHPVIEVRILLFFFFSS